MILARTGPCFFCKKWWLKHSLTLLSNTFPWTRCNSARFCSYLFWFFTCLSKYSHSLFLQSVPVFHHACQISHISTSGVFLECGNANVVFYLGMKHKRQPQSLTNKLALHFSGSLHSSRCATSGQCTIRSWYWCTCLWPPSLFRIWFSLLYNDVKCCLEVRVISQSQQETDRILRVHLFIFSISITTLLILLHWCIYITHSVRANSFRAIRAVWTHLSVIKRLWVIRREAFLQIRSGTHGWMEMI